MVVLVKDIAGAADTQQQGRKVYDAVQAALARQESVCISFAGVDIATSSFVNTAFIPLLSSLSFDEIKKRVKIVHSTKQINGKIRDQLSSAALEAA